MTKNGSPDHCSLWCHCNPTVVRNGLMQHSCKAPSLVPEHRLSGAQISSSRSSTSPLSAKSTLKSTSFGSTTKYGHLGVDWDASVPAACLYYEIYRFEKSDPKKTNRVVGLARAAQVGIRTNGAPEAHTNNRRYPTDTARGAIMRRRVGCQCRRRGKGSNRDSSSSRCTRRTSSTRRRGDCRIDRLGKNARDPVVLHGTFEAMTM